MLKTDKTLNQECKIEHTFKSGNHKGECYSGSITTCSNPVCMCEEISMTLQRDDESQGQQFSPQQFAVSLDLQNQCANEKSKKESLISYNFAKSLVADMTEEDWQVLWDYYLKIKRHQSDACNPAEVHVDFPEREIEETALMLGYNNTLPYGRQITVRVGNDDYIIMDYYCVKQFCRCTSVNLCFVPIINDMNVDYESLVLDVDYNTGKWKTEEKRDGCSCPSRKFLNTLKRKYPDLMKMLEERHSRLKLIYKHNRKLNLVSEPVKQMISTTLTVGRNDPCPCGSKKKYKKCCMRKQVASIEH